MDDQLKNDITKAREKISSLSVMLAELRAHRRRAAQVYSDLCTKVYAAEQDVHKAYEEFARTVRRGLPDDYGDYDHSPASAEAAKRIAEGRND